MLFRYLNHQVPITHLLWTISGQRCWNTSKIDRGTFTNIVQIAAAMITFSDISVKALLHPVTAVPLK